MRSFVYHLVRPDEFLGSAEQLSVPSATEPTKLSSWVRLAEVAGSVRTHITAVL
jgi:hypothetical protein